MTICLKNCDTHIKAIPISEFRYHIEYHVLGYADS